MVNTIVLEYGPVKALNRHIFTARPLDNNLFMYICQRNGDSYKIITKYSEYYDLYDFEAYFERRK